MSITLNDGTVLRNLEEQVQYLTNYHDVNQGLAQWGIRVVGQVETAAELPDPATYEGEYGDTYAVGTEAPFNFYIWTRPAIVGDPGYWFPFGEISIVGPQGPQGEKGDKGDTGESTKWITSQSIPQSPQLYNVGDIWLNTLTGEVSQVNLALDGISKGWKYVGNIRGPQGIQGPQGPKGDDGKDGAPGPQGPQGDVGGFINIWGILANAGQLPTPASLNNLTVAYLVGAAAPYDLYVQVGESSATAIWQDTGPFNAATAVSVGGVYQNVWDADTKLDKVTYTGNYDQVYIKYYNGTQGMGNISPGTSIPRSIVQRTDDGDVIVPDVPVSSNGATSKNYVDNGFVPKYTNTGSLNRAYMAKAGSAGDGTVEISQSADSNTLVQRTSNGNIKASAPVENNDLTTKQYVDENFTPKTQAATESNLGLIKSAKSYGFVVTSVGAPSADTLSLSEYTNASTAVFIGKGTLQNIIGLVEGTIIIGGESFIKRVPAYLKSEPEAYIGACCLADEVRHVLMGYDYDNDEFVVYDMSDETSTMMGDYTIEQ